MFFRCGCVPLSSWDLRVDAGQRERELIDGAMSFLGTARPHSRVLAHCGEEYWVAVADPGRTDGFDLVRFMPEPATHNRCERFLNRCSPRLSLLSLGEVQMTKEWQPAVAASMMDDFARNLVVEVRDRSVLDLSSNIRLRGEGPTVRRWRNMLEDSADGPDFLQALIPDLVDAVIANLLDAIDRGFLPLDLADEATGQRLPLTADAELTGRYFADDGWRDRFSSTLFH